MVHKIYAVGGRFEIVFRRQRNYYWHVKGIPSIRHHEAFIIKMHNRGIPHKKIASFIKFNKRTVTGFIGVLIKEGKLTRRFPHESV